MGRKRTFKGPATDDSLEAVLLPIVALAVKNRVGADRFVQATKRAYVRAAMDEAYSTDPKINYSRLAVVTGLTRKEVSSLVGHIEGSRSHPPRASREERALRVVRGWRMDPRFQDERGRPAQLPLRTGRRNFAALVKAYARDVTPLSVLNELERLNLVSRNLAKSSLRLLSRRTFPQVYAVEDLTELSRLLGDFMSTVNQRQSADDPPTFFSFRDSTLSKDQAARFGRVFSNRAAALIEGFDQWIATQALKSKRLPEGAAAARVGIGIYLVHANHRDDNRKAGPGRGRKRSTN